MKLRNKKTGKIGNFCYSHTNELCVSWQKDDGFWTKQEYNSLTELNNEWEDYGEPKEAWYIDFQGGLHCASAEDNNWSLEKIIGNYFETKEEAEKAVEKLKAWKRLKDKGFKVDLWAYDGGNYLQKIQTGRILFRVKEYEENDKDLDLLFGGEE